MDRPYLYHWLAWQEDNDASLYDFTPKVSSCSFYCTQHITKCYPLFVEATQMKDAPCNPIVFHFPRAVGGVVGFQVWSVFYSVVGVLGCGRCFGVRSVFWGVVGVLWHGRCFGVWSVFWGTVGVLGCGWCFGVRSVFWGMVSVLRCGQSFVIM